MEQSTPGLSLGVDGILDSLRTIKSFEEMPFYIGKITQLSRESLPGILPDSHGFLCNNL